MNIAILSYSSEKYKSNKLIIDAGKKRNHNVFVLSPNNLVLSSSYKGGSRIYTNENGILQRLPKIDCIIPRVATNVSHCAGIIDFFTNNLGVYSTQSGDSIRACSNKWLGIMKANANGINVPKTFYCSEFSSDNIDSFIESIKFPIILKLTHGSQGNTVMKFTDRSSLLSTAETFCQQGKPFILQEMIITKGKQHDIRAITIKNQCVASMKKTVHSRREFRSNLSKMGIGEPYSLNENEKQFISKVADAFEGGDTLGIDYILNKSGQPIFLEANSNYGTKVLQYNHNLFEDLFFHIEITLADFNSQQRKKEKEKKETEILIEENDNLKKSLGENEKLLNQIFRNQKIKKIFKSLKGKFLGYLDSEKKQKQKKINKPLDIIEMMTDMLEIEN
jgi:RimK family alpha-L-glutamate ligase